MTTKTVNKLIDKYLEGKTSPDEERRLALEVNCTGAPAEWQVVAEMLGELTLGEAIYEDTMARRRRRRVALCVGWAAAACIAFMVVMVVAGHRKPQQQEAVVLAQKAPATVPAVVQREAAPVAAEKAAVVGMPKVQKRRKPRVAAAPPEPVAAEAEPMVAEEPMVQPAMQPTMQPSTAELAQVEQNFRQWQLGWTIRNEAIELELATEQLNRKYAMYLAENRDNIEI